MNINASLKIQNVRSLNLSLGIDITRKKIDALTHESDDIIFIINTQIGKNKSIVQREFLTHLRMNRTTLSLLLTHK